MVSTSARTATTAPSTPSQKIQITEHKREDERVIPATVFLTAINPDRPVEDTHRLMVLTEDQKRGDDLLLDLRLNDESLVFLLQVIRQQFPDRFLMITDSWLPKESF